jgi:hypothetical protein
MAISRYTQNVCGGIAELATRVENAEAAGNTLKRTPGPMRGRADANIDRIANAATARAIREYWVDVMAGRVTKRMI